MSVAVRVFGQVEIVTTIVSFAMTVSAAGALSASCTVVHRSLVVEIREIRADYQTWLTQVEYDTWYMGSEVYDVCGLYGSGDAFLRDVYGAGYSPSGDEWDP